MTDIGERLRTKVDPSTHEYEYARKGERAEAADEIERLRAALLEIKQKGVTTGYGRAALSHIANKALTGREP